MPPACRHVSHRCSPSGAYVPAKQVEASVLPTPAAIWPSGEGSQRMPSPMVPAAGSKDGQGSARS